MAVMPKNYTLTNAAPAIFNAIRNDGTTNYKEYVPYATPDADSLRTIGAILMDSPDLRNQFITSLVNRIAKVIVTSKLYDNPWAVFKKGILEYGEVIENIFVEIARPFQYNPEQAEATVWKREIPNVKTSFVVMNYQKYYKQTIDDKQLSLALTSWGAVSDFIGKIITAMYTAANYDEFLVMKYMIAYAVYTNKIVKNNLILPNLGPIEELYKDAVSEVKGVSNLLTFMSPNYNIAGVRNYTNKDDQYIILPAKLDARIDVEVLAAAFNMDKADFYGHRILIDSFATLDTERLNQLLGADPNYIEFDSETLSMLEDDLFCMIVDRDWFMIYDNFIEMASLRNPEGVSWNYWLHTWKTFGINPFANAVAFITLDAPNLTSMTIVKGAVYKSGTYDLGNIGNTVNLSVNQVFSGADKSKQPVTWSIDVDYATISQSGVVTVVSNPTGNAVVTATAKNPENGELVTATINLQAMA